MSCLMLNCFVGVWIFAFCNLAIAEKATQKWPMKVTTKIDSKAMIPRFEGSGRSAALVIPSGMHNALQKHNPGFQVSGLYEDDFSSLRLLNSSNNKLPVAVIGDFDGDSRIDLAVREKRGPIYAVLSDAKGYRVLRVDCCGGLFYVKSGKKIHTYEGKEIILKTDALSIVNYGKSSAIFIYKDGEFAEHATTD